MKFTFIHDGILHIHVDSFKALQAEINADKTRETPCIIWYADGLPLAMPAYWSKCLNPKFGLRA
ncbi:hypothetical protein N836_28840 [Leptolyngbya sp. Heron Island J]|uniref:hypothetical protein n=1 Tax=Leptolyngbya sp. Heron Island J TaxID=1385935 RepID=UPI0003B97601|nr:hypothetical protein [Leptolyngbya sp. Heron Island J]ESA39085.1 hypothetical protein N836_28840 [Leptolyngbya sp. Heron Island J]